MKIAEILARKAGLAPVVSFEFFPPKTAKGEEALYRAIDELRPLGPDFVSVTYGAGGSTRAKTLEWATRIKHEHGVEAMAHFTCVGAAREEIEAQVRELEARGIENIMALRGDPPAGETAFRQVEGGFAHANELIAFLRPLFPSFSFGCAGYPQKHPKAPSLEEDIRRLGAKIDAGADFVVTQLFFENAHYFRFVELFRAARPDLVRVPVIPGLLPLASVSQVEKLVGMSGATVPESLIAEMSAARSEEEAHDVGIRHALDQARGLLSGGAPGIHFYTFNKSPATRRILAELRA